MSATKVYSGSVATLLVDGVAFDSVQAALPIQSAPIGTTAQPCGIWNHPLLPAVTRFVAARPFTGPRALMRRFGVGLDRARWLLVALEGSGVVRGHWGRLVAAGSLGGREVYSFRIYRVQPWAWRSLQGGA